MPLSARGRPRVPCTVNTPPVPAPLARDVVARLYRQAKAERWALSIDRFGEALDASAARGGSGKALVRYLEGLHLEDLALAWACADGSEPAWDHFVRELRSPLYRAADAMDPSGSARDLADSLYADLYGMRERDGERRSLLAYFHGRSSLATWLRAVLSQRFVDRVRASRRTVPLPEDPAPAMEAPARSPDPDRPRWIALLTRVLAAAIAGLAVRDRLRLACYYGRQLTLAETGRLLGEHEATASRHLTRTRRLIRVDVERRLRDEAGLGDDEIAECFASALEDAGPLDLGGLLETVEPRKESAPDRSSGEGQTR